MEGSSLVIIFPSLGFRERVVGIIDCLELPCTFGPLIGVRGYAVWVPLQCSFLVGSADLVLGCLGGDFENAI